MYSIEKKIFPEYLERIFTNFKDNVAIREGESEYTYGEMKNEVRRIENYFVELGIRLGDIVAVQLANSSREIFSIFALFEIGAIPIMVLPAYGENELEGIISVATPKFFIGMRSYFNQDYQARIEKLASKYTFIKKIIFEDEIQKCGETSGRIPVVENEVQPEDLALLLLSGGTTGIPKLIPRTHMDYIYNAEMAAKRCELTENEVYLACMPIVHNFTLCVPGILGTFYVGGCVVVSNDLGPLEILENIEEYGVTYTSLVPALEKCCCDVLEEDEDVWKLESLKKILIGGSMLDRSIAEKIISYISPNLIQVFGTAEGLICTTSLSDDRETIINTQGKPISEYDEIKIVNLDGQEVEDGKEGELITRGPYTIKEYFRLGDKNLECFTEDGFYKTGDKACILANGNIRILGRIREQINRAGEKIMPSEVEEAILKISDIRNCAVLGVRDEMMGTAIVSCVVSDEAIDDYVLKKRKCS